MKLVYKECKCLLVKLNGLLSKENVGFSVPDNEKCIFKPGQLPCIKNQTHIMQHNLEKKCPMCKPACHSSEFSVEMSQSKIFTRKPSHEKHNFNMHRNNINDDSNILPSDAVVKIVYQTNVNEYFVEKPAFEIVDFFLYTANVFNLFLGMSFVSFCEFFMQIMLSIHRYFL